MSRINSVLCTLRSLTRARFGRRLRSGGFVGALLVSLGSLGVGLTPARVAHAATTVVPCGANLSSAFTTALATGNDLTLVACQSQPYTLTIDTPPGSGNGLQQITTGQTITVFGNGATITRASTAPAFRIFDVASGARLTLIGVTLSNGDAADLGGGIRNEGGTVTLIGSVISNNKAPRGGGIGNHFGTFTSINSIVTGNTATAATGTNGGGGGIRNGDPLELCQSNITCPGGTLVLVDSDLSGNGASFDGGAIANGFTSTMSLINCTVSGNKSGAGGGGLASQGRADLTNCTVVSNIADSGGGIINAGIMTLISSPIIGNVATGSSSTSGGGGILNVGGMILSNSATIGNSTARDGGGIFNVGPAASLSLTSSPILDNNAANDGGGLANEATAAASILTGSVTANSAGHSKGGIFDPGNRVTVDPSAVFGNNPPP